MVGEVEELCPTSRCVPTTAAAGLLTRLLPPLGSTSSWHRIRLDSIGFGASLRHAGANARRLRRLACQLYGLRRPQERRGSLITSSSTTRSTSNHDRIAMCYFSSGVKTRYTCGASYGLSPL